MADAATRVLVHDLDKLGNGLDAVADHMTGRALGRGDQFAIDDEQAMVVAGYEGLDDHRTRVLVRRCESAAHRFLTGNSDGDAAAVVAVVRLGDDEPAEPARGAHGFGRRLHEFLARHRQPERAEDLVGFFLVARQLDRDVRRLAGHGRLDALLILAVAKLHQRLVVHAQPRNPALFGGVHE